MQLLALLYNLKLQQLHYISIHNINLCLLYLNLISLKQQQLLKYLHFSSHISMRHLQLVPSKILYRKSLDHQTKTNLGKVLYKAPRVGRRVITAISYLSNHSNSMQHSRQRLNLTCLSNRFQV